jgi:hypothetical protein
MAIIHFGQEIPIHKYLSDIDKYSEIEFGTPLFETKLSNLEPLSNKRQKVKKSLNSDNTKIKNLIQIYYKSCNKKEKYSIMIELNFIYMNLDEIKREKYKECRKNLIKDYVELKK